MKKAEVAAYAEAQSKGTAWLPAPIRPVAAAATSVVPGHLQDPEAVEDDGEGNDWTDEAGTCDIIQYPQAAE
ncbi:hypothetical protein G6L32_14585 [Agrobacterium tumefaciens]|nr:hypothetical protein [Agrobacterium tumefaciens]